MFATHRSLTPMNLLNQLNLRVKRNEGVNVNYRFIRELIRFHVELKVGSSAAESTVGGNGYVRDVTRRTPAWDYMCAVNDRLKPGGREELSHSRLYRTCFRKNAFARPLCGLLMLVEASFRSDGGRSIGGADSRRANGIQRHTDIGVVCSQVCDVFRQYDSACSTLSDVKTLEVLVLPFLIVVLRRFSSKYWSVMRMVEVSTTSTLSLSLSQSERRTCTRRSESRTMS
jgi:hypothetical protein